LFHFILLSFENDPALTVSIYLKIQEEFGF
jgi:hypothetical protein